MTNTLLKTILVFLITTAMVFLQADTAGAYTNPRKIKRFYEKKTDQSAPSPEQGHVFLMLKDADRPTRSGLTNITTRPRHEHPYKDNTGALSGASQGRQRE